MNSTPTKPRAQTSLKSPYKKSKQQWTPRTGNNKKLNLLRNIREILVRQKSGLEKDSLIDKANIFQSWMEDITKKITHQTSYEKKHYSLLPPPISMMATCKAETKLIEQIEQLKAEISFLTSTRAQEEKNPADEFLANLRSEFEELAQLAEEKNTKLAELKKEQDRLFQDNKNRIKEEAKKHSSESANPESVVNTGRPQGMRLFNASQLVLPTNREKKELNTAKPAKEEKKVSQTDLLASKGTKRNITTLYYGNKALELNANQEFQSSIDVMLDGTDFSFERALEDELLSSKIFALYNSLQEKTGAKAVTLSNKATEEVDLNGMLAAYMLDLLVHEIKLDSNPNEDIVAKINDHLQQQLKLLKEDAMLKKQQINHVLSQRDKEIEAEKQVLVAVKATLEKERAAREANGSLPPTSTAAIEQEVTSKVMAEFAPKLQTVQSQLAELTAMMASLNANQNSSQQPFQTPMAKTLTPMFSAAKSSTTSALSTDTINFLTLNGFSTDRSNLDKCQTSKKYPRYTPLTLAALKINEAACKALIEDGASVNSVNELGNTPLHMIGFFKPNKGEGPSIEDAERLTEYFLTHGADRTIKNKEGNTPVDTATNARIALKLKM